MSIEPLEFQTFTSGIIGTQMCSGQKEHTQNAFLTCVLCHPLLSRSVMHAELVGVGRVWFTVCPYNQPFDLRRSTSFLKCPKRMLQEKERGGPGLGECGEHVTSCTPRGPGIAQMRV